VSLNRAAELDRLLLSMGSLVRAHEILRTRFVCEPGRKVPYQVVEAEPSIHHEPLKSLPTDLRLDRLPAQSAEVPRVTIFSSDSAPKAFVLRIPMLCADLRSLLILVSQVSQRYERQETEVDVPVQYADYAEWRNDTSLADEKDDFSPFSFRRHFDSYPLPFDLPFARSFDGCSKPDHLLETRVGVELRQRLQALAEEQAVPLPDLLLSIWGILLHRHSNAEAVGILVGFDGRTLPELKSAVGPFENWIPLWINFSDRTSFAELLRTVTERAHQLSDHQDRFAFDGRYAAKAREHKPTAAFSYLKYPGEVPPLAPGWKILDLPFPGEVSRLSLMVIDQGSELNLRLRCGDPMGRQDLAAALLARFTVLAGEIASSIDRPAVAMNVLAAPELNNLIAKDPENRLSSKTVLDYFLEQVELHPDRPAVASGEEHISYRELHRRSSQVARMFRVSSGLPARTSVALAIDRSVEAVVGIMGVMLSGYTYSILDLSAPNVRLRSQLKALRPGVILATADTITRFEDETWQAPIIRFPAQDSDVWGSYARSEPQDLAYIIQTSGSTGEPKNVAVTNEGLACYIVGLCRALDIDPDNNEGLNFAVVSALHADLANTSIFGALATGGCVHLLRSDEVTDAHAFASYIQRHHIDVLKIVPTHLEALLSVRETAGLPRRVLVLGGEGFSLSLAELIRELSPRLRVFNHYGPTEATVGCLMFSLFGTPISDRARSVPIGYPLWNVRIYIVNQFLLPVPPGTPGELCIAGPGLARGYEGAPRITAERFVPCPFGPRGARMYRTGDLARQLPDGAIEFLGRSDTQVKLRGHRIELGEIEAALNAHEEVQRSLVTMFHLRSAEGQLCAYFVSMSGSILATDRLRSYLQEQLPDNMVPRHFVQLPSMPLTENGKVNRSALPVPEIPAGSHAGGSRPPATPAEQRIAEIWMRILGLEHIGVHDQFLDLGGHSLMATQIVARVRSMFGVDLSLAEFFTKATVSGVIEQLATRWPSREELEAFAATLLQPDAVLDIPPRSDPPQ
jgi:amino acid adenylation domain-containing protein